MDTGVICIQETVDNERILRIIDNEGINSEVLSKEIMQIKDIEQIGDDYYFLGKVNGEPESIYRISNNKIKRMVFDFPALIDVEKGLSKDAEDNILFIGKSTKNSSEEEVYKISPKGSISKVKDSAKEYSFVNYQ